MAEIIEYIEEDRGEDMPPKQTPVVRCNCNAKIACFDSWANSCERCGTEFNGFGQMLAPRSQWGEETGETF